MHFFSLEFIDVGKKQRALDALYDVIKSKKHRTWQKIHEQIMAKYLELCVDLRKSHIAKEGLYQYKIICQQVNISFSFSVVIFFPSFCAVCFTSVYLTSKLRVHSYDANIF